MDRTPREELQRRRQEYLTRLALFDSFYQAFDDCPEAVDYRVAEARRFRAGGDDVPPKSVPKGQSHPVHRVPKLRDTPERKAKTEAAERIEEEQSGEGDHDAFGFGGSETNLYRITAQIVRAAELWRSGVRLPAADVLELEVSALPTNLDDRELSVPKAWALLELFGVTAREWNPKKKEFNKVPVWGPLVWQVIDRAPWGYDPWNADNARGAMPGWVPIEDELRGALDWFLTTFRRDNLVKRPECPKPPPSAPPPPEHAGAAVPGQPAEAVAATAVVPGVKVPEQDQAPKPAPALLVEAIPAAADAVLAAFGLATADELVASLRSLGFADPLIARLLYWVKGAWDAVPESARPFVATRAWLEQSADEPRRSDLDAAQQGHWRAVRLVIYVLQFLGRLSSEPVRRVCVLVMAAWRVDFFGQEWERHTRDGAEAVWAALDALLREQPWVKEWAGKDDVVFRLALFHWEPEPYGWIADALAAERHEERADWLLLPPLDPLGAFYYRHVVRSKTLEHILWQKETADFHVCEHIRYLGYFRPGGRLRPREGQPGFDRAYEDWLRTVVPDWFIDFATAAILRFKFWVDDRATPRRDQEEMTFWSENHQILFAGSEYVFGHWFAGETFRYSGQKGSWHRERALGRLERWLEHRLRFGFSEVNSPVYYNLHIPAVLSVVDFVDLETEDAPLRERHQRLRTLALMVADLLAFDVVRRVCQGSFQAVTSRAYMGSKTSGWAVSIRDYVQLLTGSLGEFSSGGEGAGIALATSTYRDEVPEALIEIARQNGVPMIDRSRTSIALDEAEDHGLGVESADDIMFWWSHSAYFTEETWEPSRRWSATWHLWHCGPFQVFRHLNNAAVWLISAVVGGAETAALWHGLNAIYPPLTVFLAPRVLRVVVDTILIVLDLVLAPVRWLGEKLGILDENYEELNRAKPAVEHELERLVREFAAGSVIEREHLCVWRASDAMLSSLIDEKKATTSAQKEVCIAALGPDVTVFLSKPLNKPGVGEALGEAIESTPEGLARNLAFWETVPGAFGFTGDPVAPELGEIAEPIIVSVAGDDVFSDGPKFFHGQVSNPLVWQHENVAIAIYKPTEHQREISDRTHAHWPWDHFDEVRTQAAHGGRWVFGRRDRRFPPCTPPEPRPEWRPSKEQLWPASEPRRPETAAGSGYIALFSAQPLQPVPAGPKGWGHRELVAEGHDNIWIMIVGDQTVYASFEAFVSTVLACDLTVSIDDGECSITLPPANRFGATSKGPKFEVSWDDGATVRGAALTTAGWPRFELKASSLSASGRLPFRVQSLTDSAKDHVSWGEQAWRIEADVLDTRGATPETVTLVLEHDFRELARPRRHAPPMKPSPTAWSERLDEVGATLVGPAAARSRLGKVVHSSRRRPVGARRRDPYERPHG